MNVLEKLEEARNYYKYAYKIEPTKKQLEVLESTDEILELTFERCEGCSTVAMMKAIEYAINNQGARVSLMVPAKNVADIRLNEMREFFTSDRLKRHLLCATRNPNAITLLNGSRIDIRVLDKNGNRIRGLRTDCLIIDGKRYFSEYALNVAICSTVSNNNRQVIMLDQVDLYNGQPLNI